MIKNKICPKCKKLKSLSFFGLYKNSHTGDGHNYYCLECATGFTDAKRKLREKKKRLFLSGFRVCMRCGETKQLSEFWYKYKILPNGTLYQEWNSQCKSCRHKKPKEQIILEQKRAELFLLGKFPCRKCGEIKNISEFYDCNNTQYGIEGVCKDCRRTRRRECEGAPHRKAKNHEYNITVARGKYGELRKRWRQKNKDKLRNDENYRFHNDLQFRIKKMLRTGLNDALRDQSATKHKKTLDLLGCSIDEFMKYIESKFTEGMTWDNRGKKGWHLDHIRPCASFNLKNPKELEECAHYTNLQPLWWEDNLKKSSWYNSEYYRNFDKNKS